MGLLLALVIILILFFLGRKAYFGKPVSDKAVLDRSKKIIEKINKQREADSAVFKK